MAILSYAYGKACRFFRYRYHANIWVASIRLKPVKRESYRETNGDCNSKEIRKGSRSLWLLGFFFLDWTLEVTAPNQRKIRICCAVIWDGPAMWIAWQRAFERKKCLFPFPAYHLLLAIYIVNLILYYIYTCTALIAFSVCIKADSSPAWRRDSFNFFLDFKETFIRDRLRKMADIMKRDKPLENSRGRKLLAGGVKHLKYILYRIYVYTHVIKCCWPCTVYLQRPTLLYACWINKFFIECANIQNDPAILNTLHCCDSWTLKNPGAPIKNTKRVSGKWVQLLVYRHADAPLIDLYPLRINPVALDRE